MAVNKSKVEFPGRNCETCQTPAAVETPLRRCNGCHSALYCSKECQKEDWPIHKHLCKDQCPTVPIETRIPGVVKVGPATTIASLNAARPGDPPPKDEDRVLLYDATPEKIYETSVALMKEYKKAIKEKAKQERGESKGSDGDTTQ